MQVPSLSFKFQNDHKFLILNNRKKMPATGRQLPSVGTLMALKDEKKFKIEDIVKMPITQRSYKDQVQKMFFK